MPRLVKLSCGYCIDVTKVFPWHCKSTNISHVSRVSHGNFGQPDHYCAVLKNIYIRPCWFVYQRSIKATNKMGKAGEHLSRETLLGNTR